MPELSGRELLREWQQLMDSLVASAASVAGRAELPRQLIEPMQRQLDLLQEVIEHEQRLQRELVDALVAPVDAVFDLLEESGAGLRRQAEALGSAGRALEDAAALMESQAELFERTIGALRRPVELARAAATLDPAPRRGGTGRSRRRPRPG